MRLATSEQAIHSQGLAAHLARCLRPGVGFTHPADVLKDPWLNAAEKRAVLSSWASDASAVEDEPALRWLLGTPEPVPLVDVREALARLDRLEGLEPPSNDPEDRAAPRPGVIRPPAPRWRRPGPR
ncbi:hypothetical protein ACO2Q3_26370 [Caulobacter sp. KR2-114]|uniref:hypothetical protein n=1 Tax=Caulobacter sp. KR2-114 TaxID=3400912 RepID=UPI003C0782EF